MPTIQRHRTIDAPPAVAWAVITDHELYGEIAPNLERVEVVRGSGADLVRRCVDTGGNTWTETCTRWAAGEAFAVEVDVGNSGFHRRLFTRFSGEWLLDERPDGVRITVRFDFEPRYGPFGALITKYLDYRGPPIIDAILDRWEAEIVSRTPAESVRHDRREGPNALFR